MAFNAPLPEWQKEGSTPLQSYIQNGWGIGEFPPADWFNWQWHLTYEALKELQERAADKEDVPEGIATKDYADSILPPLVVSVVNGPAQTLTITPPFTNLTDGMILRWKTGAAFNPASRVNVNGLGLKYIFADSGGVTRFTAGSGQTIIMYYSVALDAWVALSNRVDLAPLASPAFTGTPTAPTATPGDDTTKLATTAFVTAAVAAGGGGGDMGKFVFNENGVSWIDEGTPIMIIDENLLPYSSRGKKGLWATDMVAETFESTIDSGAPFFVKSTAVVENLNADMLDGKHYWDFMLMNDGLSRQGGDFSFWDEAYEELVFIASRALTQVDSKPGIYAPNVAAEGFTAVWDDGGFITPHFKVSAQLEQTDGTPGVWAENFVADHMDVKQRVVFATADVNFSAVPGNAPFKVDSDTRVVSLNADMVDGYHTQYYTTANSIPIRDQNGDMNTRVYKSSAATGTAPLVVSSTTMTANLNADMVDGLHANVFLKNKALAPDAHGGSIYVNPTTGNDTTGNGTSGAPYKTITKALTTVEDGIYPDGATIYLSPGTYNENVNPRGGVFNNQGLVIYGDFSSPGSYIINGYVEVRRVDNFRIAGVTVRDQISFYRCKWACIETVISTGVDAVRMFAYWADGSAGIIRDSTISNKWLAISANTMSRVFSYNNTGTGNGNGLGAEMGAKVTYNGTVPSATTATRIATGGAVSTAS